MNDDTDNWDLVALRPEFTKALGDLVTLGEAGKLEMVPFEEFNKNWEEEMALGDQLASEAAVEVEKLQR